MIYKMEMVMVYGNANGGWSWWMVYRFRYVGPNITVVS